MYPYGMYLNTGITKVMIFPWLFCTSLAHPFLQHWNTKRQKMQCALKFPNRRHLGNKTRIILFIWREKSAIIVCALFRSSCRFPSSSAQNGTFEATACWLPPVPPWNRVSRFLVHFLHSLEPKMDFYFTYRFTLPHDDGDDDGESEPEVQRNKTREHVKQ